MEIGRTDRREQRRVGQPGREQEIRVLPDQRPQRLSGIGRIADLRASGDVKRRRARDDDEPGDDRGERGADDDIPARGPILPHRHALLDNRRLQVEHHPGGDGRADEANERVDVEEAVVGDVQRLGPSDRRQRRRLPVRAAPGSRRRCSRRRTAEETRKIFSMLL